MVHDRENAVTENHRSNVVLENRHTGERLTLYRVMRGDEVWLALEGCLPPHSEGPPLHIHFAENEEGQVTSGTLSAVVDGRRMSVGPGESASLPRGSAHRWWNEGGEPLEFSGYAGPVVDLDRYLQATFEVITRVPKDDLRSSTWPIWPCGTVTRRPC